MVAKQVDKEGCIVQAEDSEGRDFFFKLKTPWYCERHGLLTEDIYREHIIIGYILDDKIDDILGQIPEAEVEAHDRINKIIVIVKKAINAKMEDIKKSYQEFLDMGGDKKEYAIKNKTEPNFAQVMNLAKAESLKKMSREEILNIYDNMGDYEKALKRNDLYELSKEYVRDKTKKLMISRDWLQKIDPTLFFQDPEEDEDN